MTNPAMELHGLYAAWRARIEGSNRPLQMRAVLEPHKREGIAEIRHAFALLSSIDGVLRGLIVEGRNVTVFQKQLDVWARVPLSIAGGWGGTVQPDHLVTQDVLDQIEGFGAYLDGKVLVLAPGQHENLRGLIDSADLLLNEDDFEPTLRQYLRRLIAAIRYALDDKHAGQAFDFTAAVQQLWVAFNAAAERAPEAQKPRWRALVEQVVVGIAVAAPVEAAAVIAVSAITAGG